jgi:translation elongation factor P/translation initiation factor 5A
MYYCGDLESGSTLYIDGKQYKVFSIFESQRLTSIAIGPME